MGDDIGDIPLEQIVSEAAKTSEALASLIAYPAVKQYLDNASAWAEKEFKQDRDEIREFIVFKLCDKIATIRNPRCLDLWCFAVARHYCLDEIERRNRERTYINEMGYEYYGSQKCNGHSMVQSTPVPTPEQKFLDKERTLRVNDAVRRVAARFPKWLVDGWALGKSPKEIIKETGKPSATVYRMLKKLQKAIVEEVNGGAPIQPNDN